MLTRSEAGSIFAGMEEFDARALRKRAMHVSGVGLAVDLGLSVFKLAAGLIGHSSALVGDATHGFADVFSYFIVMIGYAMGSRESDEDHPYGHEKLEAVAGLILSGILMASGTIIGLNSLRMLVQQAWDDVAAPSLLTVAAALASIAGKEFIFFYTYGTGRKLGSTSLKASAWHCHIDALIDIGSLLGILGSRMGWPATDPAAGLVISILVIRSTIGMAHEAIEKIDDHAMDEKDVEEMKKTVLAQEGVEKIEDLKTRLSGNRAHVDITVAVEGNLSVSQAYRIASSVKEAVTGAFPQVKTCMVSTVPLL